MSDRLIFVCVGLVVGLVLGSFVNVCIARLPRHESIVKPRSRCPKCLHGIRWYDNLPLASWMVLRGRCRDCRVAIAWQYPAVELATGLWFVLIGYDLGLRLESFGPSIGAEMWASAILAAVTLAVLGLLLIGLAVMDWQTQMLPDSFTLTGVVIALLLVCTQAIFLGPKEDQVLLRHKAPITAAMSVEKGNVFLTGPEALIGGRILAIVFAAGLLLGIRALYKVLRGRQGMGLGDVKLMAMIAAFLGLRSAMLALFVGVTVAAVYALWLLGTRRADRMTRLPLGSFLAVGGLLAATFGNRLIDSYAALYR